jgi:hypothetical protein
MNTTYILKQLFNDIEHVSQTSSQFVGISSGLVLDDHTNGYSANSGGFGLVFTGLIKFQIIKSKTKKTTYKLLF